MDKEALFPLIPIVALLIPVAAIIFAGMQKVARIRLEETRLKVGAGSQSAASEAAALREDVDEVRRELAEVQERLDFTERLLARGREESHPPAQGG